MRLHRFAPSLALVLLAACGGTEPIASLAGTWNITGFRTDGVTATSASGTAVFATNGTVTFSNVIIVWPAQPTDTINVSETWSQSGGTLTLTDPSDGPSQWSIAFSGNTVVITLLNDASASRLTMQRP